MLESYVQNLISTRLGGREFGKTDVLYKFEKIKQAKRQALLLNPLTELIDLGVGEPDWMADEHVVFALAEEAGKWANRGYADNGSAEFKAAAAGYMNRIYGVDGLNPLTEINHCMGSKAALAQLPSAFINPGDITLMTVPGYPVLGTHTKWLGGEIVNLPLTQANHFLPDLNSISDEIKNRAKLLYINYPNNPTGASANAKFYEHVVRFAKENQVIVISDEAYGALTFGQEKPLSFLSVPGAKEVGVSIHSLSKAFNMTGWRLGFVAGNEWVIKAFAAAKDHFDSGQFLAIQQAGVYCLHHPEITERANVKYSRRLDLLVTALNVIGFKVKKPKGSFFLYVEAPRSIEGGPIFETAEDFCQYLIWEKGISTVPWDDAGRYIRFSVTFTATEAEEIRVIDEFIRRLTDIPFEW